LGSPVIFNGSRSKLLTSAGLLTQSNRTIDNDGVKNYIANGNFEVNAIGYNAYANTAQASPVTGSGGSPTVTIARSTTSPLFDTASGLFTKGASNLQGQGFSYDFTFDAGVRTTPCTISGVMNVLSGTYVSGDVTIWVYDVTNAVMIQPTGTSLLSAVGAMPFTASFQPNYNSTSYRLIFHVSTVSALAYSLQFDQLAVVMNTYNAGSSTTAWNSTPAPATAITNATRSNYQWRRIGDSIQVQMGVAYTGAGSLTFSTAQVLPAGLTVDNSKVGATAAGVVSVGTHYALDASISEYQGLVYYVTSTGNFSVGNATAAPPFTPGNLDATTITIIVPIVGWGTTQVLSSDTATNVVGMLATAPSLSQTTGDIVFPTVISDTNGTYNSTTGIYTIAVPGYYNIKAQVTNSGAAAGQSNGFELWKNGSASVYGGFVYGKQAGDRNVCILDVDNLPLVAGDQLKIRINASSAGTYNTFLGTPFFSVQRVSGPAQIAASEKLYLQYTGNAGTVLTANVTNLDFTTKVIDSSGAWNGTTYTATKPGWYTVLGSMAATATTTNDLYIYVNGTVKYNVCVSASARIKPFSGGTYLNQGDVMSIRSDSAITLSNEATNHWISITSQG
jgi:hypothetical protein